jgi:hypothetical protein
MRADQATGGREGAGKLTPSMDVPRTAAEKIIGEAKR